MRNLPTKKGENMLEQTKSLQTNTVKWIKEKFKAEHPLTKNEEDSLFALAKKGYTPAKVKLLRANMKFVIQVAANYHNETLSQEELINEGAIGLWRALDYYDSTRGVRFITYAVWWIKASITRAISEKGAMVRLPLNQQTLLHKAKADCAQGKKLNSRMQELDAIGGRAVSLNMPLDCEGNVRLEDLLADHNAENPEDSTAQEFLQRFTNKLLNKLPVREKQIMQDLNGINRENVRSIREESHILGLSRERIRQLRDQARVRLRHLNSDGHLTPILRELATYPGS